MNQFHLSSTSLNEIQNHEDYEIVWFSIDSYIPHEEKIAEYLVKCNSFEVCDDYIINIQSDRKILLVLIDFVEYVSYYNDFPQIQSIYVLQKDVQNLNYEKQKYSKLVDIFTDERTLIERLRQDILLTYRNDLSISISCLKEMKNEQSLTNLDPNTFMFLWNHVFIYYLVNSPDIDMNKLKQDMIEQSRLEYQNNERQLNYINDFDNNCKLDNVVNWYTKDAFVYRLVNKAFRTRNIDLICRFRYFIILLHKKLNELSIEQQKPNYTTVYRGQKLRKNDLETLKSNIGNLISTNTIFSTSRIQTVADIFSDSATEVNVIFKINIESPTNSILCPFADISQHSSYPGEEETLFFPGAIFRIDSVEKESNSRWIIKLALNNNTIEQIEELINIFGKQFTNEINLDVFYTKVDDFNLFAKYYRLLTNKRFTFKDKMTNVIGIDIIYLLNNLDNYEKTIEYYKKLLLDRKFIDNAKSIVFNILIGNNYFRLFQYDNALRYYDIALSSFNNNNNNNNQLIGEIYNHIGDVRKAMNNFQNAILYYKKALENFSNHDVPDRYYARIYRKISDIYQIQNKDIDAIIYEGKANQIDKRYRQRSRFDHEISLEYYQNQLNTQSDLLPHHRADLLYSIGVCLTMKRDYQQALERFLQAKKL